MKSYRFGDSGAYDLIEYDAIGRVWKRTGPYSNDTFYYHTSRALAQELDDQYDVITDYLASSRRYMPNEAAADKYRYYHRDHLGSVAYMTGHNLENNEEYTYDAWGEHVDTSALPNIPNKVRYAGGYVECFVNQGTQQDAIYLCGERHYWPAYGRFLQRDPLTYRRLPNPRFPVKVNPYIYAENNPIMKRDISGLSAQWYRGFYNSSGASYHLGTITPPNSACFNCDNIDIPDFDDLIDEKAIRQVSKTGEVSYFTPREVLSGFGTDDPCVALSQAQPNDACADNTHSLSPELGCALLIQCFGLGNGPGGSGPGGGEPGGNQPAPKHPGGGGGCPPLIPIAEEAPKKPFWRPKTGPLDNIEPWIPPYDGGGGGGGFRLTEAILDCIARWEGKGSFGFSWTYDADHNINTGGVLTLDESRCCFAWHWHDSLLRWTISALFQVILGMEPSGTANVSSKMLFDDLISKLRVACYQHFLMDAIEERDDYGGKIV